MKYGDDVDLNPAQAKALHNLRDRLAKAFARAEVKDWVLTQPDQHENPEFAKYVIAQIELGYPGDEEDYRKALRDRQVYLITPRGKVEKWSASEFRSGGN